jgi:acetyltransferase
MRVLGPNVVGFVDTHTPINATFLKGFRQKEKSLYFSERRDPGLHSGLEPVAGIGYSKIYSLAIRPT